MALILKFLKRFKLAGLRSTLKGFTTRKLIRKRDRTERQNVLRLKDFRTRTNRCHLCQINQFLRLKLRKREKIRAKAKAFSDNNRIKTTSRQATLVVQSTTCNSSLKEIVLAAFNKTWCKLLTRFLTKQESHQKNYQIFTVSQAKRKRQLATSDRIF